MIDASPSWCRRGIRRSSTATCSWPIATGRPAGRGTRDASALNRPSLVTSLVAAYPVGVRQDSFVLPLWTLALGGLFFGWRPAVQSPRRHSCALVNLHRQDNTATRRVTRSACNFVPRTFKRPVTWGIGPGPEILSSIGGTSAAANLWLQQAPEPVDGKQRLEWELMLTLRNTLADLPNEPSPARKRAAVSAIQRTVDFVRPGTRNGAAQAGAQPSNERPPPRGSWRGGLYSLPIGSKRRRGQRR